jgi:Terminase large subunit, T4likevirus-type, N-terminal
MAPVLATDLAMALDASRLMAACGTPPDPWQQAALRSGASRQSWLCSRQSGKSSVAAVLALHQALYAPGALVLLLSPTLRQSQELFVKVRDAYRLLGNPAPLQAESALRYEWAHGSRLIALPGTEGTIRGYSGVDLLIIDEAARVSDELYYAVRPMLAVSGGRLIALSTPWGKRGWFYEAWMSDENWARTRITASECPRIPADFLAEEKRTLPPVWYDSEYNCIFGDTVNSVFRGEDIDAMFRQDVEPLFPLGV